MEFQKSSGEFSETKRAKSTIICCSSSVQPPVFLAIVMSLLSRSFPCLSPQWLSNFVLHLPVDPAPATFLSRVIPEI